MMARGVARALCLAALVACSGAPVPRGAAAAHPVSRQTLAHMALIAWGEPTSERELDRWELEVRGKRDGLAHYVDTLLDDERFTRGQAPRFLFRTIANYPPFNTHNVAMQHTDKGVLYLHDPCKERDAVEVRPWWAPSTKVRVCASSYLPDVFVDRKGRTCSHSLSAYQDSSCGCGPNLMRCYRDRANYSELEQAGREEVVRTIAWVIEHDQPVADVFLSKSTFRTRLAELAYRRWLTESRHLPELAGLDELATWPEQGQWAPRSEEKPDEHAGILTTPVVAWYDTGVRPTLKFVYDAMWCSGVKSSGVTSASMIQLAREGDADLREGFDASKVLAHTYPCADCHARLEYGGQFFLGYRTNPMLYHFDPASQNNGQTGRLYGDDDHDVIGDAELTPQGFAKLATSTPRFGACMSRRVVDHVFGDRQDVTDLVRVQAAYDARPTVRSMMRTALLALANRADAPATPQALDARGLHAQIEQRCTDCHHSWDDQITNGQLPAPLAREMLVKVAFGLMPKAPVELATADRNALIEGFVRYLWHDPAQQQQALAYYRDRDRAIGTTDLLSALSVVHARAGANSGLEWGFIMLEPFVSPKELQYTPGFAAAVGLDALASCEKAGKTGKDLDDCVAAVVKTTELARKPLAN